MVMPGHVRGSLFGSVLANIFDKFYVQEPLFGNVRGQCSGALFGNVRGSLFGSVFADPLDEINVQEPLFGNVRGQCSGMFGGIVRECSGIIVRERFS